MCPGSSKGNHLRVHFLKLFLAPGPIFLTFGTQRHTMAFPIRGLPLGPVSKIPAAPISPTKLLPQELEKREGGSKGRGPRRQAHRGY